MTVAYVKSETISNTTCTIFLFGLTELNQITSVSQEIIIDQFFIQLSTP